MKIFVGIDIAKLNHFAAAISSDGEILIEPFKFTNDADGFQLLVPSYIRTIRSWMRQRPSLVFPGSSI